MFYTCLRFCSRGGLCPGGVSVQEVSVQVGLWPGVLCPGASLSRRSLSRMVSVQEGVSVQGDLSRGVSVQGISVQKVSVQMGLCLSGLCPGVSVQGGLFQADLPLLYDYVRAVSILLECILVYWTTFHKSKLCCRPFFLSRVRRELWNFSLRMCHCHPLEVLHRIFCIKTCDENWCHMSYVNGWFVKVCLLSWNICEKKSHINCSVTLLCLYKVQLNLLNL